MCELQAYDKSRNILSYGIMNTVRSVPAGFTVETIVQTGVAVNAVMGLWGDRMRRRYGKSRDYRARDLTTRYIGYSTDNGCDCGCCECGRCAVRHTLPAA